MNADPQVVEFLPGVMTRAESDGFVQDRLVTHFAEYGYGPWAVQRSDTGEFIGYVGLMWQTFDAPFTPALEVGWRLSSRNWGCGYATEAARESLRIAFDVLGEVEVVSMTVPQNTKSIAVMQRIGMARDPIDDFDHPRLPEHHRLRRHVLHRLPVARWRASPRESVSEQTRL
jgi:RimJ/RimL family protein N-acetyltransferase